MKQVQFTRAARPFGQYGCGYQVGDVAQFNDDLATDLIARGTAVAYGSPMDKQSDGPAQRLYRGRPVTKGARKPAGNGVGE